MQQAKLVIFVGRKFGDDVEERKSNSRSGGQTGDKLIRTTTSAQVQNWKSEIRARWQSVGVDTFRHCFTGLGALLEAQ